MVPLRRNMQIFKYFFLIPGVFYNVSAYLEGEEYTTIGYSICVYNNLYSHAENFFPNVSQVFFEKFKQGLHQAMNKLTKYFNLGCLISFGSMVLDPRLKLEVYDRNNWSDEAKYMLEKYILLYQ